MTGKLPRKRTTNAVKLNKNTFPKLSPAAASAPTPALPAAARSAARRASRPAPAPRPPPDIITKKQQKNKREGWVNGKNAKLRDEEIESRVRTGKRTKASVSSRYTEIKKSTRNKKLFSTRSEVKRREPKIGGDKGTRPA